MDFCRDHQIAYEDYFECPVCVSNAQLRSLKRQLQDLSDSNLHRGPDAMAVLTELQEILDDNDNWSTQ